MTTETEAKPISQILATLVSPSGQPITPPQNPAFSASEKPSKPLSPEEKAERQRKWLEKWLSMRITHPQVEFAGNEIYDLCAEYAEHPSVGKTVVIHGENGCGKSHIVRRVGYWAQRIAMKIPMVNTDMGFGLASVSFAQWPEVVDGFKRDQWTVLDDFMEATMLILDDIGAEHDPSKIGVEKLYVLLNRREKKWNFVTTNILPGEWQEKFERRIASRLFRNAHHIDLSNVPDYSTT